MPLTDDCTRLLQQAQQFAPLYGDRLANHLPMGLIALDRMGAAPRDLERFYRHEARALAPLGDAAKVAACATADSASAPAGAAHDVGFFRAQIQAHGVDAVLHTHLPRLMPGVGASAFHALIRLAYALDAQDAAEISHALALWSLEYLPFDGSPVPTDETPGQIALRLQEHTAAHRSSRGIIVDKMRHIAALPAVRGAHIQPASISLDGIARFSLAAFAQTDDFTLLHLLTATHALRLVLPWCSDQESALRHFWHAALIAWLTVRHAPHAASDLADGSDWPQAFNLAAASNDAHTIKLVYSAFQEAQHYGDPRYLAIARRRVRADTIAADAAR